MNGIKTGKDFWPVRSRVTRPPFGYKFNSEDKKIYPQADQLSVLSAALDDLEGGQSLRQVLGNFNENIAKIDPSLKISIATLRFYYIQQRRPDYVKTKPKKVSREEGKVKRAAAKIAIERRRITAAAKRIRKLDDKKSTLEVEKKKKETPAAPAVILEIDTSQLVGTPSEGRPIVFESNPGPQTAFLEAPERQVLYGGAAGGGKSYALLADPMRWFNHPEFNGILFRRTNDELRELKNKSKILYPAALRAMGHKDASLKLYNEKDSEWRLPAGGHLWFTYLDRDDDVLRYQGQAFSWIGFDELTQWASPHVFNYMMSRLRSTNPELSQNLAMRATSNPGGPGHGWVKQMFIDPAPPNTPFWAVDENGQPLIVPEGDEDFTPEEWGKPLMKRLFIPAKLKDNPYLSKDRMYKINLLGLPERQRLQLLEGDWSIADGAAFPEFRTATHVIEPISLPHSWKRFRSMDWGYQSAHAIHWYAVDPFDNQLIVYREFYGGGLTAKEVASLVLYLEREERVEYGMLDSSVWHKRSEGPSPAEEMISAGCRWRPSDRSSGSRIAGKNMLHQLLRVNEDTDRPGIVFFDTCRHAIADLQVAPADPDGGDDIDERYRQRNHAYDSIRYGIMSRPKPRALFDFGSNTDVAYNRPADPRFGY